MRLEHLRTNELHDVKIDTHAINYTRIDRVCVNTHAKLPPLIFDFLAFIGIAAYR
jgi:hypothetical protein